MAVYLIYPHPPAVLHMNMPSSGYTGGGGGDIPNLLIIQFYSHKCYHMYMNLRAKASCAIVDNPALQTAPYATEFPPQSWSK